MYKLIKFLILLFLLSFARFSFAYTDAEALQACNADVDTLTRADTYHQYAFSCGFDGVWNQNPSVCRYVEYRCGASSGSSCTNLHYFSFQCSDRVCPSGYYINEAYQCFPGGKICPDGSTIAPYNSCPSNTCPSGQTYNTTTKTCQPVVTCSSGLYNNNGTCTLIPDCNASTDGGGNFWDVNTNQCMTAQGIVSCITGSSTVLKWCPPISECKESGYICQNDPTEVATQKVISDTERAAALFKAQQAKDSTTDSLNKVQTPLVAAQLDKQQAQTNVTTTKAALEALAADPHSSTTAKDEAAQAYGEALNQFSVASKKLQDIENSQSIIQHDHETTTNSVGAIPGASSSPEAAKLADDALKAATDAIDRLADALAGGGVGSGNGLLGSASGTLQGILDALTKGTTSSGASLGTYNGGASGLGGGFGSGSGGGQNQGIDTDGDGECDVDCPEDTDGDGQCDVNCTSDGHGDFSQSQQAAQDALDSAKNDLDTLLADISNSTKNIIGGISNGSGTLPVVDFGEMKGVSVVVDLNKYASQLSVVSSIILALAWVSALSIILSNKG